MAHESKIEAIARQTVKGFRDSTPHPGRAEASALGCRRKRRVGVVSLAAASGAPRRRIAAGASVSRDPAQVAAEPSDPEQVRRPTFPLCRFDDRAENARPRHRYTVPQADVHAEPVKHCYVPGDDGYLQSLRLSGEAKHAFFVIPHSDILMSDEGDNLVSNRERGRLAKIAGCRRRADWPDQAEAGAIPARGRGTRGHPRKHTEENREREGQSNAVCPVRDRRGSRGEDSRPGLQVVTHTSYDWRRTQEGVE